MTFRPVDVCALSPALQLFFRVDGKPRRACTLTIGERAELCLVCDSRLAVQSAALVLWRDGEEAAPRRFSFSKGTMSAAKARFSLSIDSAALTQGGDLFFYEVILQTTSGALFVRERTARTLKGAFSYGGESPAVTLACAPFYCREDAPPLVLTVQNGAFPAPPTSAGQVIYHIFVDRFRREGVDFNPDFSLEFPKERGAAYPNDRHYGGSLWGICERLPYLASLGVDTLYLSPIFTAFSNHKYDTGDYETVDERFGADAAFDALCAAAKQRNIRLLLDGVFNHTGAKSRYFESACRGETPYRDWYGFSPDGGYTCWWGQKNLPKLNTADESLRGYFAGEAGIVRRWIRRGACGFRLDVVDEYPDSFLALLRAACRAEDEKALFLGEVWEDAALKVSYGARRRYFADELLDGVTNYPVRNLLLDYLVRGDAQPLFEGLSRLLMHYPKAALNSSMCILSTHDTPRALSVLADAGIEKVTDNETLSEFRLDETQRALAAARLKLAFLLQFALPGAPTIYYGDEAGMEGGADPFNRQPYPWGGEDADILAACKKISAFYKAHSALQNGDTALLYAQGGLFAFLRENEDERLLIVSNAADTCPEFQIFCRRSLAFSLCGAERLGACDAHIYKIE